MTNAATNATAISTDLRCKGCGYNLRTRPTTGICPECATPVADSLEFERTGGRNFRQLQQGSILLALATLMGFFIDVVLHSDQVLTQLGSGLSQIATSTVHAVMCVALFGGVYRLASRRSFKKAKWRALSLACVVLAALFAALNLVSNFPSLWTRFVPPLPPYLKVDLTLRGWLEACNVLLLIAGAIFIRRLAREFRRPRLTTAAFVAFGLAAFTPALLALAELGRVLSIHRVRGWDWLFLLRLYVPQRFQVLVCAAGEIGIIGLWIVVAIIAWQARRPIRSPIQPRLR